MMTKRVQRPSGTQEGPSLGMNTLQAAHVHSETPPTAGPPHDKLYINRLLGTSLGPLSQHLMRKDARFARWGVPPHERVIVVLICIGRVLVLLKVSGHKHVVEVGHLAHSLAIWQRVRQVALLQEAVVGVGLHAEGHLA